MSVETAPVPDPVSEPAAPVLAPPVLAAPVFAPPLFPAAGAIPRAELFRRVTALVVALGAGAVLLVAAGLSPSGRGLGTHEQLNLPACGWITLMDLPCPTCGMTTSFAHAANGDLLGSFAAQPLGFLLALATAMAFMVAVYVVATGSHIASVLTRLWGRYTGWLLTALVLAAWGYKVVSYRGLL